MFGTTWKNSGKNGNLGHPVLVICMKPVSNGGYNVMITLAGLRSRKEDLRY